MSPVLPTSNTSTVQAAPPPNSAPAIGSGAAVGSQATARPVNPGEDLGHPHQLLSPVALRAPAQAPQQPSSGTGLAVPASTLVDGGADHAEKRTALVKQRIDGWLNNHRRTADDIYRALNGKTELGELPPTQQRYLISRAFDYMGVSGFRGLAQLVQNDARVRGVVAEALIKRAVQSESTPRGSGGALDANDPHNYARAFASHALNAMSGDKAGLVELLLQMPPLGGALFAQALGDGDRPDSGERLSKARNQVLSALNGARHTATTSAIVEGLFLQTSPADITSTTGLADNMVMAVAREYHPDDKAGARAEMPRLEALMRGQGAQLLFGGSIARKQIVYAAARDARINAGIFDRQTLNYYGGDPARIPVVAEAMARARIAAADAGRVSVDTPAEENTKQRLAGILQTRGGQELFFSGRAPAEAIDLALQIIRSHPEITFETFGGMKGKGNPWGIPELARPIAEAYAAGSHDQRPVRVPGAFGVENLVVGPAMGIVPTLPRGDGWQDWFSTFNKAVADGTVTLEQIREQSEAISDISLYDKTDQAIVHEIARKIRHVASTDPPRVDCEYVTLFTDCGPIRCPRFRVQNGVDAKGLPTYAYVDNTGADYANLAAWEDKNQLPAGVVYHPKIDKDGKSILVSRLTPEASKSTAGKVVDAAALVGCYAAGVAAIVFSGGAIAVVGAGVAAASGGWMAYRSGSNLHDRHARGQSISNLDALGDWLGVAGGVAGAGALAAGLKGAAAFGALQKAAVGINLAGFGYQAAMLAVNWPHMTPEQRQAALVQTMAIGGLMVAHGAASPAMPGRSPVKNLDARPTAALSNSAQPASTQTGAPPSYKLNKPVKLPAKEPPNVYTPSNPPQPTGGPRPFDGTARWGTRGGPASTLVPPELPASPDGGGQLGEAPAHADAPRKPPAAPSTSSSGAPKPGEVAPSGPAGKGGTSGTSGSPEDRIARIHEALFAADPNDLEKIAGLKNALAQAEKDLARQANQPPADLASLTDAREKAEEAYRGATPGERDALRRAFERAKMEEAVAWSQRRPAVDPPGLKKLPAEPTPPAKGSTAPSKPSTQSSRTPPTTEGHPAAPKGGPGAAPTVGQAPTPWSTLTDRVRKAVRDLYSIESSHKVFETPGPLDFGQAAKPYRQALQEASDALRAYNAAGAKNPKELTHLNKTDRANPRGQLPLRDLKEVFPDLAQVLHKLHEPSRSAPRHPYDAQGRFEERVKAASRDWDTFAGEAAKGNGLTPELVEALTKANRSLVSLERNLNDAPPDQVKSWQDRIEQARQILDGYVAEIWVESQLTIPALRDPAAVPKPGNRGWGGDATNWVDDLREEFGVPSTSMSGIHTPRVPDHPQTSYQLARLAEAANEANRNLKFAIDGDDLPAFWDAVIKSSHAMRDLDMALNGLEPKSLSRPDTWNPQVKAWRDQLAEGVSILEGQARELKINIKLEEQVLDIALNELGPASPSLPVLNTWNPRQMKAWHAQLADAVRAQRADAVRIWEGQAQELEVSIKLEERDILQDPARADVRPLLKSRLEDVQTVLQTMKRDRVFRSRLEDVQTVLQMVEQDRAKAAAVGPAPALPDRVKSHLIDYPR